jgi:ABC-type multidrug transport system fused ATPase/permease subunit
VPRFLHNVSDLIRRDRPSLLILDEATSALDMATEAKLLHAFRSLPGKLMMVVAVHRLSPWRTAIN